MPRTLQLDSNGDLNFTEKVVDEDGDNVSHPLTNIVQIESINGNEPQDRTPDWLNASVNELGNVNGRWEEEVNVTIEDAESNLELGNYTFEFRADDGEEFTIHTVLLEVT